MTTSRKRRSSTKPEVTKADHSAFAKEVERAYRIARGLQSLEAGGQPEEDARRVGTGLALINELLDAYAAKMKLSGELPGSGLRDAYGIVEHLTTGRDHPIARHILGIKTDQFRRGKMRPTGETRLAQIVAVAAVRGYAMKAGGQQAPARRAVIAQAALYKIVLTATDLKNWHDAFQVEKDIGPDVFANELVNGCSDAQQVLELGATWIWKFWAVPSLPDKKIISPLSG
ncbi:MAG: hypothetical protein WDN46_20970 [Methylocella sp.]